MDAATRKIVYDRANGRCEYCQLPQAAAPYLRFHVEHVVARQHMLDDSLDNLALSCPDCNRRKGPNLTTIEWETGALVRLFHPRHDRWVEHFEVRGAAIEGRSLIGNATIRLLHMNSEAQLEMRTELLATGEWIR